MKEEMCYICEMCGMAYVGKTKMCECDDGCKIHNDCDIAVLGNSIEQKMEVNAR